MRIENRHSVTFFCSSAILHLAIGSIAFLSNQNLEPTEHLVKIKISRIEQHAPQIAAPQVTRKKEILLDKPAAKVQPVAPAPVPPKVKRPVVAKVAQKPALPQTSGSENVNAPVLSPKLQASYEQAIAGWLEKHKRYPRQALRRGLMGQSELFLELAENGKVLQAKISRASEYAIFDDEVLAMVRRAEPFPTVPEGYPKGLKLKFSIPVSFKIS